MTKISIIIPCFNSEKYLSTCLNSVLNQTLQDIEVICINDASRDTTLDILKRFEKEYSYKMKVINHEENLGVSASRNKGLEIAQGEYIGFVDSDDIITVTMYEDLYRIIREYKTKIAITVSDRINSYEYINQEFLYQENRKTPYITDLVKRPMSLYRETPSCCDKLFLHDFIEKERFLEGHIFEDISFTLPLLLKAKKVVSIDQIDYFYRNTPNGIMDSSRINEKILDIFDIYVDALERAEKYKLYKAQRKVLNEILHDVVFYKSEEIQRWKISEEKKYPLLDDYKLLYHYYIHGDRFFIHNAEEASHEKDKLTRQIIKLKTSIK